MGMTLWHVPISHYSEKARWALDFKQIPHARRRPLGGAHPLVSLLLTRGRAQTVPVLTVDGRGIGDSTAIIAALEQRVPEPALYPEDPAERRRALELEDFFDEQVGPYVRRLAYHDLTGDPQALAELTSMMVPWSTPRTLALHEQVLRAFVDARFRVRSDDGAREAEEKLLAGLDVLEAELAGGEHLCAGRFTVADLTAASILYPIVLPPEGPWQPREAPAAWSARMERLAGRPAARWVRQTYARHRRAGGAAPAADRPVGLVAAEAG